MATLAAGDLRAGGAQFRQACLHAGKRGFVDQRADQDGIVVQRISHRRGRINMLQPLDERGVDVAMHEQPAQSGTALAGSADGRKGDRAQRNLEVGRATDDGGVVAAEF